MSDTTAARMAEISERIADLEQELAELRQSRSAQPVADYQFTVDGGARVALADLFGDHDRLIAIHNMGFDCAYCTMWADGFNGLLPHLQERAAFVVTSPDPPAVQRSGAAKRGWRFRMVSTRGTTFAKDMGFEGNDGAPLPGVSTFVKAEDGSIRRHDSAPFGPGDKFCPVWSFADLLPRD